MQPHERIIVALYLDDVDQALEITTILRPYVGMFKIGLQLQHALLVRMLSTSQSERRLDDIQRLFVQVSGRLMWDGKLHDIPNTVGKAAKEIGGALSATMFTIHASGGVEMILAAVANKGTAKVLGVTVLTSLDDKTCARSYGVRPDIKVSEFADMLIEAGADGIVCSPLELRLICAAKKIDRETGEKTPRFEKLLKVIPGIRLSGSSNHDQARVMTPSDAIQAGADYLVIGRDITQARNLVGTAKRIAEEIALALDHDTEPAPPVLEATNERT